MGSGPHYRLRRCLLPLALLLLPLCLLLCLRCGRLDWDRLRLRRSESLRRSRDRTASTDADFGRASVCRDRVDWVWLRRRLRTSLCLPRDRGASMEEERLEASASSLRATFGAFWGSGLVGEGI